MNLSFIVKAVPTVPSDEKQEEPTHEVLQVSLDLFNEHCLLIVKVHKTHSVLMFSQTPRLLNPSELERTLMTFRM